MYSIYDVLIYDNGNVFIVLYVIEVLYCIIISMVIFKFDGIIYLETMKIVYFNNENDTYI